MAPGSLVRSSTARLRTDGGSAARNAATHERAIQPYFQHTDLLAVRRQVLHRLVDGVGARSHDHDHTLGAGVADVLEQAVAPARELGKPRIVRSTTPGHSS